MNPNTTVKIELWEYKTIVLLFFPIDKWVTKEYYALAFYDCEWKLVFGHVSKQNHDRRSN